MSFLPKHNNWPICDAEAPMTALGQQSLVPALSTGRAPVALQVWTTHTAHEAPSQGGFVCLFRGHCGPEGRLIGAGSNDDASTHNYSSWINPFVEPHHLLMKL